MIFNSAYYLIVRPFLVFFLYALLLLTISRLGLSWWQFDRLADLSTLWVVLGNGLRVDLSTIAYLLILPALVHPFIIKTRLKTKWLAILSKWFLICIGILLFLELSTPAFMAEYELRPNRLFVEYLSYPKEVMSMLFNGHLLEIIASIFGMFFGLKISWYLIRGFMAHNTTTTTLAMPATLISAVVLVLTLLLFARGTVSHRPLNPSVVYFSTDPLVNTLTLNSAYSVAFSLKQMGNEINAGEMYGKMPADKIIALVREDSELPLASFTNPDIPTAAARLPFYQGKPKNLVIILEESLGAQFVGSLGGINLSPQLDKIMASAWSFDQLYATGTRSVRGIEAVVSGFTPTPARSVVKLDKSQSNFFTLASLLAKHDYTTQFIYGGESHFDNMKSFFLGNGFTDIVDFNDMVNPSFVASWGASDEDLFNQANIELTKLHHDNKPFFSLIFSSSNHDPFDVPADKTQSLTYSDQEKTYYGATELARHKAIQYADYALGKFIETASKQAYWQDTVFLIVADHDARVHGGDGLVPIKNFHVPGVILNSGLAPKRDKRMISQIDLAPTLLSLMGISDATPMIGFDLTKTHSKERVMMQFANNFAYMVNNEVAILQPNKPITYYQYDLLTKKLSDSQANQRLGEQALAHVLFGSLAYRENLYRLPDSK